MMSYQGGAISHTHKVCSSSTNTELIGAIQSGQLPAVAPHLYTADRQNAGRGQHGRSWLSPAGNVYLSLYLPTPTHLHKLDGSLSLCVGLSLVQMPIMTAINQKRQRQHLPPIMVKWANDLGIYDGVFYKLAGVLIEPVIKTHLVGVVIGVGLNLSVAPAITDGLYHATSLYQLDPSCTLDAHDLYAPICQALLAASDTHNAQAHLNGEFIHTFNKTHILHGKHVTIYPQNKRTISHCGLCTGIDPNGALLLDDLPVFHGMAVLS